ncbi:MAG: disulfide oxidoreductase, partial [Alphaproteobacteria bacterium]
RPLSAPELAQIAGRAGRYMNDGTFGTTAEVGPLDAETVESIENHRFAPVRAVYWRNTDLAFTTVKTLIKALETAPPAPELRLKRDADDQRALEALSRDRAISALAGRREAVKRLWEVCRIPDFRKEVSESHTRLLARIYKHLMGPDQCLPEDWVAAQIARLERSDGDIDSLTSRIDHIRTWTYVSYRADWLRDAAHWQERTRAIEDRLSDALHQRLTQRFVDRRTTVLVKRLKEEGELLAAVKPSGEVLVEGHFIGRLEGFRFVPDEAEARPGNKAIMNAAVRALRGEIAARIDALEHDGVSAFALDREGRVVWRDAAVARPTAGPDMLAPRVDVLASELLSGEQTAALRRRLEAWLAAEVKRRLPDLFRAREVIAAEKLSAPVRGLLYQLVEALGTLPRRQAAVRISALAPLDRKAFARFGVRLGVQTVFMPSLLATRAIRMRALLWAAHKRKARGGGGDPGWPEAPAGLSAPRDEGIADGFYRAVGYLPLGPRVLRVDQAEKLAAAARTLARQGPFTATRSLAKLAGCATSELGPVLAGLGFQTIEGADGVSFAPSSRSAARKRRRKGVRAGRKLGRRGRGAAADSPFAALRELDFTP